MKQKEIFIIAIIAILAILACLTTYMIVNSSHEDTYSTLRISSSCSVEVPSAENSTDHLANGITRYSFPSKDLNITYQKSGNNTELKKMNSDQISNSKPVEGNIYFDEETGIYSTFIENSQSGEALLITAADLDMLKRVSTSVKFAKSADTVVEDNNTTSDEEILDEVYEEYEEGEYDDSYYDYGGGSYTPPSNEGSNDPAPSEQPQEDEVIIR